MAEGDDEDDTDAIGRDLLEELGLETSEPTLIDWQQMDVEESPIAFMNQFLYGGPLDDYDRFVLNYDITPEDDAGDAYPDWHSKTDLSPVLWGLLLKKVRNEKSDEKLEFHLKGNPEVAEEAGFEDVGDVPRNTTFWRAYANTDANDPRFDEDTMQFLDTEADKIIHHAKYVGFDLPENAEERFADSTLTKQDLMEVAEEIAQRLLKLVLPHIAFGRDPSRTTYSLPSFASFMAHLALEDTFPENGSETFAYMDIYENGSTGADNFYHYVKTRNAEDWFDCFL